MSKLTQEEATQILIQHDVFNQSGEVDQASMFHISTHHSPVLIVELLELLEYDADEMYTLFRGLYNEQLYDAAISMLKLLYFTFELEIPYVIEAIFQSGNEKVKSIYLSEFLDDLENEIFDYGKTEI